MEMELPTVTKLMMAQTLKTLVITPIALFQLVSATDDWMEMV